MAVDRGNKNLHSFCLLENRFLAHISYLRSFGGGVRHQVTARESKSGRWHSLVPRVIFSFQCGLFIEGSISDLNHFPWNYRKNHMIFYWTISISSIFNPWLPHLPDPFFLAFSNGDHFATRRGRYRRTPRGPQTLLMLHHWNWRNWRKHCHHHLHSPKLT